MKPALSIITPHWNRFACLVQCIQQVKRQTLRPIQHIVIADGPNDDAREVCRHFDVEYWELDTRHGDWGKPALDRGLKHARADYVCFWDDDNLYPEDAAVKLLSAADGFDLGIVRIENWDKFHHRFVTVPRQWDFTIRPGDIDTSSGCVRRQFLLEHRLTPGTVAPGKTDADARLWEEVQRRGGRVNFVPTTALSHV